MSSINLLNFLKNCEQNNLFWCPSPYSQLDISPLGTYAVCCRAPHFDYSIHTTDLNEHFNSSEMRSLRSEFEEGIPQENVNKYCSRCLLHEKNGIVSKRQRLFQNLYYYIRNQEYTDFQDALWKNLSRSKNHECLDISDLRFYLTDLKIFGNLCNLKCVMCFPRFSNLIAEEEGIVPALSNPYQELSSEKRTILLQQLIEQVLPNTARVKVIGGEPLINKDFLNFVSLVSEQEYAPNLELQVTTNGTTFVSEFIDNCRKFKNVLLSISIDAYGSLNNVQRRNSNFEKIDKNVDRYLVHRDILDLEIISTITNLNCSRLDEMHMYGQSKNIQVRSSIVVVDPKEFSVLILPKNISDLYLNKFFRSKFNRHYFNVIQALQNSQYDENLFLVYLDKISSLFDRTKLLKYFPEYRMFI